MKNRAAFTLVELLVVITIIGILIGLLLPAVQSARESGRRAQCNNNLKQLTLAAIQHESVHTYYPTGGWVWQWAGDPDRGTGQRQPGGWTYNILPFTENSNIHDLGIGMSVAGKKVALATAGAMPLSMFYCPTRRQAVAYPNLNIPGNTLECNANWHPLDGRTDYAANAGSDETGAWWTGAPTTSTNGDPSFFDVPGYTPMNGGTIYDPNAYDGIMYSLSVVTHADIRSGTQNTFILGEKYLDADHYTDGQDGKDNNPIFGGFDWDWNRWGGSSAASGSPTVVLNNVTIVPLPPIRDRSGYSDSYSFGSAHVDGLNMFMCDGSGHFISFNIDPVTFAQLTCRNNTAPIDNSKLKW